MHPRHLPVLALGLSLAATGASPANAADEPEELGDSWVTVDEDGYHRWTIPHAAVREAVGAEPLAVEVRASFGPAGAVADLATELQGGEYVTATGRLAPGLYLYQLSVTLGDRSRVAFTPSGAEWEPLFVPGAEAQWFADAERPGTVTELGDALVWTPAGFEAERTAPYPTLYLLAGAEQDPRDWVTFGRAPQVLDRLLAASEIEPMVVVMARVADAAEISRSLEPALRKAFPVGGGVRAVAGIGDAALVALEALRLQRMEAAGLLSPRLDGARPEALEESDRVRVYVGNVLDPAYDDTFELLQALGSADFDGVQPRSGGTWDTWREALRNFAPYAFTPDAGKGPRPGHLPLAGPYVPPTEVTTPHVDENGIVTFLTDERWKDATEVRVWGSWAPNGSWFRIPMQREGDRWRLTLGPLDGYYYYRYVVDGDDEVKDPTDTVNTMTGVTQLFVPGETDQLLADAPEGQGGQLEVLDYESTVAPGERKAYVWTPPGYDPDRAEPYPVLYLNHGGGQSWGDWVENGRAVQIMDNLTIAGEAVPMVVVMGDGNVRDYPSELLDNLVPAAEAQYNISSDPARRAIAGLSMGAMNSLTTWVTRPGEIRWVGAFSGFFFQTPEFDAEAVNAGTTLAVIHTGDSSDFTHDGTYGLMAMLDERGVAYEFPGETYGPHGFDTWMANLIDFVPRLFKDEGAASPGAEPTTTDEPIETEAQGPDQPGGSSLAPVIALGAASLAVLGAVLGWALRRRRKT